MDKAGVMTECEMGEGLFFFREVPRAAWKCALTDVGASTVVAFLFVEQNQK